MDPRQKSQPLPDPISQAFKDLPVKPRTEYAVALAFVREYNTAFGTSLRTHAFGEDSDGVDFICKDEKNNPFNLQICVVESAPGQIPVNLGRDHTGIAMGWKPNDLGLMSPVISSDGFRVRLTEILKAKFLNRPGPGCALAIWYIDMLDMAEFALDGIATPLINMPSPYTNGVWLLSGVHLDPVKFIPLDPLLK